MKKFSAYMSATYISAFAILLFAACEGEGVNGSPCKGESHGHFNPEISYGFFTDSRDGKCYRAVKIGTQTWMAENLNYAGAGNNIGRCYNDSTAYCDAYGRLYDWDAAMKACPAGWRLPDTAEWQTLVNYADPNYPNYSTPEVQNVAGEKLMARSGWRIYGNGIDSYGFSALPGGYFTIELPPIPQAVPQAPPSVTSFADFEGFYYAGRATQWWTANELKEGLFFTKAMFGYSAVRTEALNRSRLASVRCLLK